MKFGVCAGTDAAPALAAAGFGYLELNVQNHLKPEQEEAVFRAELDRMRVAALPVEAANCFLPGNLKVCGPEIDGARAKRYVETALARAERAGISVIVFGSGGARAIPAGYDRDAAWHQIVEFARGAGAVAERHGVTIVVEPLNRKECNVLNSVTEGARFVREVDHPAVRLLVDAYHWALEAETEQAIVDAGPLLRHAHIATKEHRMAPGLEPHDFAPFFRAMKAADYAGRLSVEAKFNDLAAEAAGVFRTLTDAAAL